jgi:DNA polymerase
MVAGREDMTHRLSLDFETRSVVDLRRTGVYPYAEHPLTGIWCCAYAFDDEEVEVWVPGQPIPDLWQQALSEKWEFRAWNAQFERVMWDRHGVVRLGFPRVPLEQWFDTAADAAAMALPRALVKCAEVLGLSQQKDTAGHRLMLQMARPRIAHLTTPVWRDTPDRLERLYEYCRQDVRVERGVYHRTRRLSSNEREVYLLDQRINDRGVLLDTALVEGARCITTEGLERANTLIRDLTDGDVESVTKVADLKQWLGDQGVAVNDVTKNTIRELLEGDGLGDAARRVLELRAETGRSSVAKLDAMMTVRCADDRLRGLLLYHGASTGRWSGKLVQPQNFPRGEIKDAEAFIPAILDRDYDAIDAVAPPLVVVSALLRGCLVPADGHTFMAADFSSIEARVLAWLADQEDMLALFRAHGPVYETMAARIYEKNVEDVTPQERQAGKAAVLGCGYQMGAAKFQSSASTQYGVAFSRENARLVIDTYRAQNSNIVRFWADVNRAAVEATADPGKVTYVGSGIRMKWGHPGLWVRLPSGRLLFYANATIAQRETPWGAQTDAVVYYGTNSYTRKWEEQVLYGGKITENIVSATARDLLASAMLRVDRAGFPVILSVHDEVLAEVPVSPSLPFELFMQLMSDVPAWAHGCPVAAEGWTGLRYRK